MCSCVEKKLKANKKFCGNCFRFGLTNKISLSILQSGNPCAYVTANNQAEHRQAYQYHNLLLQFLNHFWILKKKEKLIQQLESFFGFHFTKTELKSFEKKIFFLLLIQIINLPCKLKSLVLVENLFLNSRWVNWLSRIISLTSHVIREVIMSIVMRNFMLNNLFHGFLMLLDC